MSDTDPFQTAGEPNYLEALVGEGKKFKTVDDLARGKAESDTYIETLKTKLAEAEAKASNGVNVDTLLTEIKKLNEGKTVDNNGQPVVNTDPPVIPDIGDTVLQTLRKIENERAVQNNKQAVISKMNEVWGADSGKELKKTADALNVSVEYLNQVAQQSPSVFFQLTGLNANRSVPSGTTVPTSRVNFEGSKGERNQSFYAELKKTNPTLYKDIKTQVQMQEDAYRLGESFFNV